MKPTTKTVTDDQLEEIFMQRQRNDAIAQPKRNGITSADDIIKAGVQATQNVAALRGQENDHMTIKTQNVMLLVKDLQAGFERTTKDCDGGFEFEFEIE